MLDETADIGATSITTEVAVDWVAGEDIIICVTDFDHRRSEVRTITGATTTLGKTTLTFAEPLVNKHFAGDIQIDNTWT
ncbi:MAG: hypothetical protein QF704_15645 [Anaerolineales bacterium]|jgi:hypothetical protein|nr:hypothetical protein [Anaerolineales bacterium]